MEPEREGPGGGDPRGQSPRRPRQSRSQYPVNVSGEEAVQPRRNMEMSTDSRNLPLGVSMDGRRYRARIRVHRRERYLGNFDTVEEAAAARRAAEKAKLRDRFMANVGPLDPVTTCREWQGTMSITGYGMISVG